MDRYARPVYVPKTDKQTIQAKVYYQRHFAGDLVSYQGNDVEIAVWLYDKRGRHTKSENHTFNVNILGADDQKFLEKYRKTEKATHETPKQPGGHRDPPRACLTGGKNSNPPPGMPTGKP